MNQHQHDNRFAPPRAEVAEPLPVSAGGEAVLAERALRLAAFAIDTAAILVLLLVVDWQTPWDPFAAEEDFWTLDLLPALWSLGAFLVLNLYLLLRRGQTLGKALLGLRVVRPDGSHPSAWRLVGLRHGVFVLLGVSAGVALLATLVDSLFIFGARRRCLHDVLADTLVVKA